MALNKQFGSLIPSQTTVALDSNYLQWTDSSSSDNFADFAQQYLPENLRSRSRALWKQNVIWIFTNGRR